MMSRTHFIVLTSAISLLLFVLELVRRRRLREEYSWLWLLTSCSYLLLALSPLLYTWVAGIIGATNDTLAFSFLGFYFLVFISIQFSVKLSRLSTQNKDLAQHVAILDSEMRRLVQLPEAHGRLHEEHVPGNGASWDHLNSCVAPANSGSNGAWDEHDTLEPAAALPPSARNGALL